jgi:hypothetical protein
MLTVAGTLPYTQNSADCRRAGSLLQDTLAAAWSGQRAFRRSESQKQDPVVGVQLLRQLQNEYVDVRHRQGLKTL